MRRLILVGLVALFVPASPVALADPTAGQSYVDAGTTMAVFLTTVSHETVDRDIARVLAASANPFHDDFAQRSGEFARVVREARSSSTGTVTDAHLESLTGDTAVVAAAVSVGTSNAGGPPEQRDWRLRVTVARTGDRYLVSNVEFLP